MPLSAVQDALTVVVPSLTPVILPPLTVAISCECIRADEQHNYFSMRGKQWWQQVWDRFSWLVCGYGEKLRRFVVTFLLTIIIPAIGYLFCGIKVGDKTIRYPLIDGTEFSLINFVKDFGKCLHFSIVTFSTVGYGNIVPSGISYIISAIQILIGVLFVALFTSIMLKKILR